MKAFVVDSSVCLKWVLDDEIETKYAKELQRQYLNGKVNLVAPDLWFYEVVNVIKNIKIKKPKTTKTFLEKKLIDLMASSPSLIDMSELGPLCLRYAISLGTTAYDSAYIALAHAHGLTLITADNKLVAKVNDSRLAISLKDFPSSTS